MNIKQSGSTSGFTLIEAMVVIVVIGILASITALSYGNWRQSTTVAQLKSDLNGVTAAMKSTRTFSGAYPLTVPSTFTPSDGVTLSGGGSADGKSFCVTATNGSTSYLITNDSAPVAGTCS